MSSGAFSALLVEDDDSYAQLVAGMFAASRHAVSVARVRTLDEARARAESEPFDAAVVDLARTDATDLAAVSTFRQALPSLPLVALTPSDDPDLAARLLQAGAQDSVSKTDLDADRLTRALRYAIERGRGEELAAAESRLRFLHEAARLLVPIEPGPSLDDVAALAARTVCDLSAIVLVDRAGEVEQVHIAHRDAEVQRGFADVGEALRRREIRLPIVYEDVMRERTVRIAHDIEGAGVGRHVTEAGAALVGGRIRSVMIAPLVGKDRVRGIVAFVSLDPRRAYGDRDRAVAEDLASRLALAIDNARLYREARELFDADLTANFVASADGLLLACNGTFARLLRFEDPAAAFGRSAVSLFGGLGRWDDFVRHLSREGVVRPREIELTARDGTRVQVVASAVGMFDDRNRLLRLRGQFYDLSEHKLLEAQLAQSQRIEAIGRLAGGIAHDFNNLLTLILGHVERLQSSLADHDPLRRSADEVLRAANRAAALTQQLLAFSRRQVLSQKTVSVNDIVRNTHAMLTRVLGEDITFELSLASDLRAVRADPVRLEQALLNLAINARDAMPNGGVLSIATANVEIDEAYCRQHISARPGQYVRLTVSDTGAGMDAETRERAFEPFFTTKEVGKGTGLGLSMVYGTVKQSGGYIWVYSEPGVGATFKIYLPVVDAPLDVEAPPPAAAVERGSETILLVEDEEGVREVIEDTLTSHGYRVLAASRGPEALQIAEFVEGDIHLLVTDVVMPQMSGREVALRLTARRPEMRVLYLSGYTDDAILHHGILEPGAAFLQKPFAAAELARKVREVLGSPVR